MQPLAERLRPTTLDEYVGQRHLVGEGGVIRRMIDARRVSSFILWGPPGVGKTTLAGIIARTLDVPFFTLSAVTSGVKEVREVIDRARKGSSLFAQRGNPILFIDEIHRFSKSQQDSLLGAVEQGVVTLIGATTENPSFEVIRPLLSRCQVYVLQPLDRDELQQLLDRALSMDTTLRERGVKVEQTGALFRQSGGDGRKLLNILELTVESQEGADEPVVDDERVLAAIQQNPLAYDKDGEMHYDIISAFIKSIRGSDPNAAIYYMCRMLDGGEDPLFIARRLCLSASEDVGLANPNALLLAEATFRVVHEIGMPEARIPLAECTVYLASSPKSNASYMAMERAMQAAKEDKTAAVPLHLRNAPTTLMEELGYSDGYKYAHDYPGNFVDQEFLPKGLEGTVFYEPQSNRHEDVLRAYLERCWPKYYEQKKK